MDSVRGYWDGFRDYLQETGNGISAGFGDILVDPGTWKRVIDWGSLGAWPLPTEYKFGAAVAKKAMDNYLERPVPATV